VAASIAVVVPTHNRADRLPRLIRALENQELRPVEVVFVDDGSADETPETLAELARTAHLPVRVIRLATPAGPAVARNEGWRSTSAPFVAFTDDDCQPTPAWLARAAAAIERRPQVGIVQGTVRPDPDGDLTGWPATRQILQPTPYFEGCNLLVRREALDESGGFGEALRIGGEDTWLGWAVLRGGWDRAFASDALVYHDVTHPGLRWHLRQSWLNGNVAPLVKEFPELRGGFWRPWALRSSHPAFVSFVVGMAASPRRPGAIVLALPYLYLRVWRHRTSRPDLAWLKGRVFVAMTDAVEVASTVRLAVRNRVVLI
jgi:glycosyltransferase involved in cell wall biosynthesis